MAKSDGQKLKLMYIRQFLEDQSDEQHPVTTQDILEYLESYGIQAERKSIYSDIACLQDFGMDILHKGGRYGGYYLASRPFELPELKLLVDAVQSSRFLTSKKSAQLISKLGQLASQHEAVTLRRQMLVSGRVKTMNESIYYNVDSIHEAIAQNSQIKFQYFDWALDGTRVFRDKSYYASPYALIWDNENYYLLAYDPDAAQLRHYRVDRMESISVIDVPREGHALFQQVDMAVYTREVFDMFSGQPTEVKLRFHNSLAGAVLDHFGQEVFLIPDGSDHFTLRTRVAVSPRFFAWLCAFGTKAQLLEPAGVVQQLQAHLSDLSRMYEE